MTVCDGSEVRLFPLRQDLLTDKTKGSATTDTHIRWQESVSRSQGFIQCKLSEYAGRQIIDTRQDKTRMKKPDKTKEDKSKGGKTTVQEQQRKSEEENRVTKQGLFEEAKGCETFDFSRFCKPGRLSGTSSSESFNFLELAFFSSLVTFFCDLTRPDGIPFLAQ